MTNRFMQEQMDSGENYFETSELKEEQAFYRDLLFQFNHTLPSKQEEKAKILAELLGSFGEGLKRKIYCVMAVFFFLFLLAVLLIFQSA